MARILGPQLDGRVRGKRWCDSSMIRATDSPSGEASSSWGFQVSSRSRAEGADSVGLGDSTPNRAGFVASLPGVRVGRTVSGPPSEGIHSPPPRARRAFAGADAADDGRV